MEVATPHLLRLRNRLLDIGRPSIRPSGLGATRTIAPEAAAAFDRVLPFAEAMYLVMTANPHAGAPERDTLRGTIRALTDGLLSSHALDAMIERFDAQSIHQGREARFDEVADALSEDSEDAELALALAGAVALADDHVLAPERKMLEALGERLGMSRERIQRVLHGGG